MHPAEVLLHKVVNHFATYTVQPEISEDIRDYLNRPREKAILWMSGGKVFNTAREAKRWAKGFLTDKTVDDYQPTPLYRYTMMVAGLRMAYTKVQTSWDRRKDALIPYWLAPHGILQEVDRTKKPAEGFHPLCWADRPIAEERLKELWAESGGKVKAFARLIEQEHGIKEWEVE